jgi:hypothetical protein
MGQDTWATKRLGFAKLITRCGPRRPPPCVPIPLTTRELMNRDGGRERNGERNSRALQCKVEPTGARGNRGDRPNQCCGGHDRRAGGGQPAAVGVGVLLLVVLVLAVGPRGRGRRPPPPQQEAARHPQHAHGR